MCSRRSAVVATLLSVLCLAGQPGDVGADTRGPRTGTLFIVGGGRRDPKVVRQFLDLAGGPDAPIVIVPTAGDDDTYSQDYPGTKQFRDAGATKITVLHTRDRAVADTDAFVAPLETARGVFFQGGRPTPRASACSPIARSISTCCGETASST